MIATAVARDLDGVARLRAEWDALAVECAAPYAAPAWAVAWWRHLRPAGAELAVVAVRDGDRLVGVAPLHAVGREWAPLGFRLFSDTGVLAAPGHERAVASAVAEALADERCEMLKLLLQREDRAWGAALADAWPARPPWRWFPRTVTAPGVRLPEGADLDAWLASKSSSFRAWVRRGRRKFAETGAEWRLADIDSLASDVDALLRLHVARRGRRTELAQPGMAPMLVDVGRELVPDGRFRLLVAEVDGRPIAAQLMAAAGGEVGGWNSGFDPEFAKLSPAMLAIVEGLAVALERGDRYYDLGPGEGAYKDRLSDASRRLISGVIVPRGARYPLVRARLAGRVAVVLTRRRAGQALADARRAAGRAGRAPRPRAETGP